MTPSTRTLVEALIRLGKGALDACDKWVKAQPDESRPAARSFVSGESNNSALR